LAGSRRGVTVSALTNADSADSADSADLSRAICDRMKSRGELGNDERTYDAVDQRGEQYAIPIATGDKLRLFRRTWARIDGKGGSIGNNGDIVEVVGRMANGLLLRDRDGRVGGGGVAPPRTQADRPVAGWVRARHDDRRRPGHHVGRAH